MIGYLVTAWYYDLPISLLPLCGAAISVLLVSSAGFIINDIIDIDIDRINRPDRVLAAGLISVPVACVLYVIYNLLGIGIAFVTSGPAVAAIAILVGAALF